MSADEIAQGPDVNPNALKGYIERIERLEADKREIGEDIKEVLAEAKSNGFDTKVMKAIVRERRKSETERQTDAMVFETYAKAVELKLF